MATSTQRGIMLLCILFLATTAVVEAQRWGCYRYALWHGETDPDMPRYWLGYGMVGMDINKNGHTDLLASAFGPKKVFVYFGGPELFDTTPDLELRGSAEMVTGDFNGDGLQDLAVRMKSYRDSNWVLSPDTILIYMGVEDSTYAIETTPRHSFTFPVDSIYDSTGDMGEVLLAGDLTGNGRDELIISTILSANYHLDEYKSPGIFVWHYPRGDASDTLTYLKTSDKPGRKIRSVKVGDVNGDGLADIVMAVYERAGVGLPFRHVVRVGFGRPDRYPDLSKPDQLLGADVLRFDATNPWYVLDVELLDVNNDGISDLLWRAGRSADDSLHVMYGGVGGLEGKVGRLIPNPDPESWFAGFGRRHHRIGDYNGDGYDDFVMQLYAGAFRAKVVFLGDANGITDEAVTVCVGDGSYAGRYIVDLGDIDGRGGAEYATSTPYPINQMDLRYNPGYILVVQGQWWITLDAEDDHGSADLPEALSVEVYPHPGRGEINLLLRSETFGPCRLQIHAADGRLLLDRSHELTQRETHLTIQHGEFMSVPVPGLYMLSITRGGNTLRRSVLLQ